MFEIDYSNYNFVQLLWWLENNISLSIIGTMPYLKWILFKTILFNYSWEFEAILHYRTLVDQYIPMVSLKPELCSTAAANFRHCFSAYYRHSIRVGLNDSNQYFVDLFTWIHMNCWWLYITIISHWKWIVFIRFRSHYWDRFDGNLHHRTAVEYYVESKEI